MGLYNFFSPHIMTKTTLSFPIYSSVQKINLPYPIKNCFAIRVNQLTFKFNDFNKKLFLLSLSSLDNHKYFDGSKLDNYTFIFFNDGSKSTLNYLNNLNTYDSTFKSRNLEYLDICIKIDGNADQVISLENPVYIELDFIEAN